MPRTPQPVRPAPPAPRTSRAQHPARGSQCSPRGWPAEAVTHTCPLPRSRGQTGAQVVERQPRQRMQNKQVTGKHGTTHPAREHVGVSVCCGHTDVAGLRAFVGLGVPLCELGAASLSRLALTTRTVGGSQSRASTLGSSLSGWAAASCPDGPAPVQVPVLVCPPRHGHGPPPPPPVHPAHTPGAWSLRKTGSWPGVDVGARKRPQHCPGQSGLGTGAVLQQCPRDTPDSSRGAPPCREHLTWEHPLREHPWKHLPPPASLPQGAPPPQVPKRDQGKGLPIISRVGATACEEVLLC